MNPKLIAFTILAIVALICSTVILCVHMIVKSNERQQQQFLVHVPAKTSGA